MIRLMLIALALVAFSMSTQALASEGAGHAPAAGHRDNTALFPPLKPDISKATAPVHTELLEPGFQAKTEAQVTLKWKSVAGATSYHVQLATDPNFKWLVINDYEVKGTELPASNLKPGQMYFWRVAGWHKGNMAGTQKADFVSSTFETR